MLDPEEAKDEAVVPEAFETFFNRRSYSATVPYSSLAMRLAGAAPTPDSARRARARRIEAHLTQEHESVGCGDPALIARPLLPSGRLAIEHRSARPSEPTRNCSVAKMPAGSCVRSILASSPNRRVSLEEPQGRSLGSRPTRDANATPSSVFAVFATDGTRAQLPFRSSMRLLAHPYQEPVPGITPTNGARFDEASGVIARHRE